MIVSKLEHNDYTYISLHAEEVITSNFLEDQNSGIYGDRLQIGTFQRVATALKSGAPKNLILDFRYITACQSNLNRIIFDLKNFGFKMLFTNISKGLCEELSLTSILNDKNQLKADVYLKYYFFENSEDPFISIDIDIQGLFKETFKRKVLTYIKTHTKPHTSSYVYLTSYVDVKEFVSCEREFILFSLYKLALKIKAEWKQELDKKPILICQSMNSAYIVSILSSLLNLDILILDKIGPVNKLYNRLDNTISDKRKYIVVSDLVCLGTEVKIVKNLIQFVGGKYLGNVSLIKVETLDKSDIKRADATIATFSISKENNKELNYSITTDLQPI